MPVYKDKNGKWIARFYYTDYEGVRRQAKKRGFTTSRDAKEYERQFLTADRYDQNMTFAQASKIFLEDKENRLKPTTYRQYENTLETIILPLWGNIPVANITSRHVINLQKRLASMGLKPSTIGKYEATTKTIYRYVAKLCKVKADPFSDIPTLGKPPRKQLDFWTLEQYTAFRNTLKKDIRLLSAFDTLFYTGIRIGELRALRRCDIDTEKNTLHIRATYNSYHGIEEISTPKTENSERDIIAPQFVIDEILEYYKGFYGASEKTRLYSFISQQHLRDTVKRYCQKNKGTPYIKLHAFRHSHVALLINEGIDLLTISERLGHATPTITMNIYSHLYPDKQGKVADLLDRLPR